MATPKGKKSEEEEKEEGLKQITNGTGIVCHSFDCKSTDNKMILIHSNEFKKRMPQTINSFQHI